MSSLVPYNTGGADLSAYVGYLLAADPAGAGDFALIPMAAVTDRPAAALVGFLANATQDPIFVEFGLVELVAGATPPAYLDAVAAAADGSVVPALGAKAGSWLIGQCLSAGAAAGDLITVLLDLTALRQLYLRTPFDYDRHF